MLTVRDARFVASRRTNNARSVLITQSHDPRCLVARNGRIKYGGGNS